GLGTLGDVDAQHAVAAGGGDAIRIGAVRQGEAAVEAAPLALAPGVALVLLLLFAGALALEGEHAAVHLHLDVLRVHARDVGEDDEAVALFPDVHPRCPLAGHHVGLVGERIAEEAFEDLLELLLQVAARQAVEGGVTDDAHVGRSPLSGPPGGHARKMGAPRGLSTPLHGRQARQRLDCVQPTHAHRARNPTWPSRSAIPSPKSCSSASAKAWRTWTPPPCSRHARWCCSPCRARSPRPAR